MRATETVRRRACTRLRCAARSGSSRVAAALHRRRGGPGGRPVRRPDAVGHDHAAAAARVPVAGAARLHRRVRLRPRRCRAATTSTSRPTSTSPALEDGEVPLLLLFSGTVFTGAPGIDRGDAGAVAQGDHGADAGGGLARGDGRPLPRPGLAAPRPATPTTGSPPTAAGTGWPAGTTRSTRLLEEAGRVTATTDRARRGARAWPTRCSTRATCSTPTAPPRRRTRCAGSGAC